MFLKHLKLINFRNYINFDSSFSNAVNIFIGNNAQGKTNLIEAIYIIGASKSFRRIEDDNLIRIGSEFATIQANVQKGDLNRDIAFQLLSNRRKQIVVNNKKIHKTSDYIGNLNVTLFSPEDLFLIKGDASFRRRFIDTMLCQTDSVYMNNLIQFQRILKQRNVMLKEIRSGDKKRNLLEPWNDQLCAFSSEIIKKREESAIKINEIAKKVQNMINNDELLSTHYLNSLYQDQSSTRHSYCDDFKQKLQDIEREEIGRGTTLIGPHRDDLEIKINDLSARFFGSQGQQRSAAISLKMAEVEYIRSIKQEYPILLLDDIFSELDDTRKRYLLNYLNQDIQLFLAGTRKQDFQPLLDHGQLYYIDNGVATLSEGDK